ncbi:MAG: helix-turn-helix domain-containing protein [Puniceicoccales bacterium]|jgi:transcriptional regulator with XRE-family HTH domain|nr:helix-turn-helix domain-containing protein [Puniceicoccales bacterium]
MSRFSTALRAIVESGTLSQAALAKELKMDISQFNQYCNGRATVGGAVFVKISKRFPPETQAHLLRAYLLDCIPRGQEKLVDIHERLEAAAEPESDGLEYLPDSIKNALRYIGARCTERNVADLILDLERLLKGNIPK